MRICAHSHGSLGTVLALATVGAVYQIVGMVLDRHSIRHPAKWSTLADSGCISIALGTEARP